MLITYCILDLFLWPI